MHSRDPSFEKWESHANALFITLSYHHEELYLMIHPSGSILENTISSMSLLALSSSLHMTLAVLPSSLISRNFLQVKILCPLLTQNQNFSLGTCFLSSPILMPGNIEDLWPCLPQFLQFPSKYVIYSGQPHSILWGV